VYFEGLRRLEIVNVAHCNVLLQHGACPGRAEAQWLLDCMAEIAMGGRVI
jgi:hypothetical protein